MKASVCFKQSAHKIVEQRQNPYPQTFLLEKLETGQGAFAMLLTYSDDTCTNLFVWSILRPLTRG